MKWFLAMVRIVGASFPFAGSMVQLNAELSDNELQERLKRIDDPISHIHPDVREVAEHIYRALRQSGRFPVPFTREFYEKYARALAMLEAQLLITGTHTTGGRFYTGIYPNGPAFVLYMCGLYEEPQRMSRLVERVDTAKPGTWLKGAELSAQLGLPVPVVRAVFESFEDRGLGSLSKESGVSNYRARA